MKSNGWDSVVREEVKGLRKRRIEVVKGGPALLIIPFKM